jgi:predicted transglutaminase-like cysteine proteinase
MTNRSNCLAFGTLLCVMTQPAASTTKEIAPVLAPMGHTFFCLRYPDECRVEATKPFRPNDAATQWQALHVVQTRVNAGIAPQDDDSGPADRNWLIWPPSGDCDDYAVTKRHELLQGGWSSSDLLLAEVRLISTGKHHLVLVVHGVGGEWVLDSRKSDVVHFGDVREEYIWLRVQSAENPKFWNRAFGELQLD